MPAKPKTPEEFLQQQPADRQQALREVRKVILKNLPKGYEESMNWGGIVYQVPLKTLPDTYNGQPLCLAALCSTKSYMTLHLMTVYGDKPTEKWFRERFKASGKKLDMGKACVHFKKLEDLPLDVIGETIARVPVDAYVRRYKEITKRRK
jgi:hypothetical protein